MSNCTAQDQSATSAGPAAEERGYRPSRYLVTTEVYQQYRTSFGATTLREVITETIEDLESGRGYALEHGESVAEYRDRTGDLIVWEGNRAAALIRIGDDGHPVVIRFDEDDQAQAELKAQAHAWETSPPLSGRALQIDRTMRAIERYHATQADAVAAEKALEARTGARADKDELARLEQFSENASGIAEDAVEHLVSIIAAWGIDESAPPVVLGVIVNGMLYVDGSDPEDANTNRVYRVLTIRLADQIVNLDTLASDPLSKWRIREG